MELEQIIEENHDLKTVLYALREEKFNITILAGEDVTASYEILFTKTDYLVLKHRDHETLYIHPMGSSILYEPFKKEK